MLEEIKNNFQQLIALYESQREANAVLTRQLEQSRAREEALQQEISGLKTEMENLKLTGAFVGSSPSTAAAKEKVTKLVREIDRCISLLEN